MALEPTWRVVANLVAGFGWTSIWILLYLFPDGRFVPRWTRLVAVIFITIQVLQVLGQVFPNLPFNQVTSSRLHDCLLAPILVGSCLFAQIYRYRRVSGPVQRQQTKWFVFGVTIALSIAGLITEVLGQLFPALNQAGPLYALGAQTILALTLPLIPLSIAIAILRYRLWDIDLVINRTLVYGTLTAIIAGLGLFIDSAKNPTFKDPTRPAA